MKYIDLIISLPKLIGYGVQAVKMILDAIETIKYKKEVEKAFDAVKNTGDPGALGSVLRKHKL